MELFRGGAPGPWGVRRPAGVLVAIIIATCFVLGLAAPANAGGPTARVATAGDLRSLVNAERRARGLAPVTVQAQLAEAARRHSRDMADHGYASHTSRDGTNLRGRVRATGYLRNVRSWVLGEAIAWGEGASAAAPRVLAALMASPTHKAVLLDPDVRQVGVGITRGLPRAGGSGRGITVVLNFGTRRR